MLLLSYIYTWKVHLEDCWSKSDQNNGAGRKSIRTFPSLLTSFTKSIPYLSMAPFKQVASGYSPLHHARAPRVITPIEAVVRSPWGGTCLYRYITMGTNHHHQQLKKHIRVHHLSMNRESCRQHKITPL